MKQLFLITTLFCLSTHLLAKDPAMKKAKEEAQDFAKKGLSQLQSNLRNDKMGVSEQDFLPDEDKMKTFDAKVADNDFDDISSHANESDLQKFIQTTKKREALEENEEFLMQGHQIVQNPQSSLDIISLETSLTIEEESLMTCQEEGTYQRSVEQTLFVQVSPDIKSSTKHCQGHEKIKNYEIDKEAKHHLTSTKEALKQNPEIKSYEVHRNITEVTATWTHNDNIGSCDHFFMEETIQQVGSETDTWETEQSEILSTIESTPSCKLLYTTILKGPETRIINGRPVYRDIWARQHHFSCEADAESKCAQLRLQGAVLVSKKCLITNVFDECDLWEKTYDLGKKAAFQKAGATFKSDELWGLNDEFDTTYDKNTDFGQVLATLSIFSDLENNLEEQNTDFHGNVQVFKGEDLKCEKSFIGGSVFDCCKKMDGLAVDIKLASCKSEEKCLAKHRSNGKCHFIGSQKTKLGSVTEHVYCCFPTKLARVIHEQGRKQLGIKWGRTDKPKCRGFSLEELQKINFGSIDLSDVLDDIKVDKKAFANKLKQSVAPLQAKVQADIAKMKIPKPDEKSHKELDSVANQEETND